MSVGVAFAASADDVVVSEMNDEISINESIGYTEVESDTLEISEDATIKEDVQTVTEDTFFNYFDKTGSMLDTGNELIFEGDFSDIGISSITIDKPAIFTGNGAVFKDVTFVINSDYVFIDGFTITQNNGVKAISIESSSTVFLSNNIINYSAKSGQDGYAIFANQTNNLLIMDNVINYVGNTMGDNINNAIYLTESDDVIIFGNEFNLSLVSAYVSWSESPSGSGNWVSLPVSEGIVVESSDGVNFLNNTVYVSYNNVVGSYDTIYSINFKNSDNARIIGNNITSLCHTYVYGVTVSGDNFNISYNNITAVSDSYYANCIDIEGSVNGVVENNYLRAKSPVSAYIIYLADIDGNSHVNYIGNAIIGDAYNVFGLSLGYGESNIEDNFIILSGNYTTGIAYMGSNLNVKNNLIYVNGTNVGNMSIWESFPIRTIGITVKSGNGSISGNSIESSGEYVIDLGKDNVALNGNSLSSKHEKGYYVVIIDGLSVGSYFNSKETNIALNKDNNDVVITLTSNGVPISDAKLIYTVNGGIPQYGITDDEGKMRVHDLVGNVDVDVYFLGKNDYGKSNAKVSFNNEKSNPNLNVTYYQDSASSLKLHITANENFNGKVTIKISQRTFTLRLSNGIGELSVKDLSKGTYTLLATCDEDDDFYSGEFRTAVTVGPFYDDEPDDEPDYYLFVPDIEFNYGETGLVEITVDGEGSRIDAEILDCDSYRMKYNQNNIFISGLDAGTYTLSVTYGFGEDYGYEITKTSTITVKKVAAKVSFGDVSFDYGKSGSTTVTLDGASSFSARVIDHPEAVISINNNVITVSGLNAGSYTLSVTSVPDSNHNAYTKGAAIRVNKVDSSVSFGDVSFDYGKSGSTAVALDGASSFSASVVGHPEAVVSINNNVITVSGLNAGSYTLSVTSVPDSYHNAVTKTSTITVKKVASSVRLSDVSFGYGKSGSTAVALDGASSFSASVVGHSEAIVSVKGNVITVSGLMPGTYTLSVATTSDANHESGVGTATITVTKSNVNIKATVKSGVYYKSSNTWKFKVTDDNGNPVANTKVSITIFTGSTSNTYTVNTDSNGEATFKSPTISVGTHNVVVNVVSDLYDSQPVTTSVNVLKPLTVKYVKVIAEPKDGGTALTIKIKVNGKYVQGVKFKFVIYKGSKAVKTLNLKTKKVKNYCAIGYATNKLSKGTYTVKIIPYDNIKYSGSKTIKNAIKITKKGKWERKLTS